VTTSIELLLLTGEGLSAMSPAHLETLEQMLGGLGLRLTVVQAAVKNEPPHEAVVPATRDDFCAFAEIHGYTAARAYRAWNAVLNTKYYPGHCAGQEGPDPFPPLRFIHADIDTVDLRSVYDRLVASNLSPRAWRIRITSDTVRFLAHMVNEELAPLDPLPLNAG
jgi:hypothetical protein